MDLDIDVNIEYLRPVVTERLKLQQFGIGVPFVFLGAGLAVIYAAYPGLATLSAQNNYARLGLAIMLVVAGFLLAAASYTYLLLDTGWWLLTRERDGPGGEA